MKVERNLRPRLPDGTELAADLYRPAVGERHPTLIVYLPYHKDDVATALYDRAHRFFASQGYACLLVDMRGTGGSEGVAPPCFDPTEGDDGAELVRWAARQPWSDGSVGMWGISYPAINAIKVAARNPAPLKAIVAIMGTADPYQDWFFPGGARNCLGTHGGWGTSMVAMQLMPPTYRDPAGRWERVWRQRLETLTPWIVQWYEHPEHDEFWASRVVPYDQVTTPAFFVNGWRDIFPDAMVRGYRHAAGPKKLLAGPWLHMLPDVAAVHATSYLPEVLQWWDYWLKGIDNGVMNEPPVRYFAQRSNVWRHAPQWPPGTSSRSFHIATGGRLSREASADTEAVDLEADPTVGTSSGLLDPMGLGVGLPAEQSADDTRSLTFTSEPVNADVEIVGHPEVELRVARHDPDSPVDVVVKLTDVDPRGRSQLITRGVARLDPEDPPRDGRAEMVDTLTVSLHGTAYVVPSGHRLRISIALADFPLLWPLPENSRLRVLVGAPPSVLRVPTRGPEGTGNDATLPATDAAENRAAAAIYARPRWTVTQDHVEQTVTVEIGLDAGLYAADGRSRLTIVHRARAMTSRQLPDSTRIVASRSITIDRPSAGTIEVHAESLVTLRELTVHGLVTMDGRTLYERSWQRRLGVPSTATTYAPGEE